MNSQSNSSSLCDPKMSFEDCEFTILRHAIDTNEKNRLKHEIISKKEELESMFQILRNFLKKNRLVLYGGFAINSILPDKAKFYDENYDIPDFDFYSPTPMHHVVELADIYHKKGFKDIEAKSGVHFGTYKLFVNFIPVADITLLDRVIFTNIQKKAVVKDGIHYSPPNFLRMNMYLELSRPMGQVDRWEKVLKRLNLLNQYYPIEDEMREIKCTQVSFQRMMKENKDNSVHIHNLVRDAFVLLGCVFFGGYATSLYAKYMTAKQQKLVRDIPDFDVLHDNPYEVAETVKTVLNDAGFAEVTLTKHAAVDSIIPESVEIKVGVDTIAFVYKPIACHNYNKIVMDGKELRIATIDTMLSLYFAFYYSSQPYYYRDRILCMVQFLFQVEEKNRLEQKGLLQRFVMDCKGKQETLKDMQILKMRKYEELRSQPNTLEYLTWFFRYNPSSPLMRKRVHTLLGKKPSMHTTGSVGSTASSFRKKTHPRTHRHRLRPRRPFPQRNRHMTEKNFLKKYLHI